MRHVISDVWNFVKGIFDKFRNGLGAIGHFFSGALGSVGHLIGLAGGGTAMAGQAYVVGEHGPELFTPSQSGTITPNGAMGAHRSSSGATINITGINMANPQQVAAEVAWALKTSPAGQM